MVRWRSAKGGLLDAFQEDHPEILWGPSELDLFAFISSWMFGPLEGCMSPLEAFSRPLGVPLRGRWRLMLNFWEQSRSSWAGLGLGTGRLVRVSGRLKFYRGGVVGPSSGPLGSLPGRQGAVWNALEAILMSLGWQNKA